MVSKSKGNKEATRISRIGWILLVSALLILQATLVHPSVWCQVQALGTSNRTIHKASNKTSKETNKKTNKKSKQSSKKDSGVLVEKPKKATRTITVTSTGSVSVVPDTASIQLHVEVTDTELLATIIKSNEAMGRIYKLLEERGVAQGDIQSSCKTITCDYNYETSPETIEGYRVYQIFSCTVRNLEYLYEIMNEVINNHGRPEFMYLNKTDLTEAYAEAVQKARALADIQAEQTAALYGLKIDPEPVEVISDEVDDSISSYSSFYFDERPQDEDVDEQDAFFLHYLRTKIPVNVKIKASYRILNDK